MNHVLEEEVTLVFDFVGSSRHHITSQSDWTKKKDEQPIEQTKGFWQFVQSYYETPLW